MDQANQELEERAYDDAPHMHAGTVAPKLSLRAHDGGLALFDLEIRNRRH